jgi:opacity protein-like surface antigen
MGGAGPDTYLELHLGGFVPQSSDLDGFDPGIALGGTFGARFNPNLSAELEAAYYRSSAGNSGFDTHLGVFPVTASLRLRYPAKFAELSGFAGGGLHFAHLWNSLASSDDTAFGWHVGAEAAFNLSPTMRIGFEVRRTFVNASFEGVDVNLGGLRLAATLGYHF